MHLVESLKILKDWCFLYFSRAQKLDGAFFEAFATVDQKQKGFLKQAKQDSKKQAKTLIEKQEADANSVFYSLFSKDSFTRSQVNKYFFATDLLNY